MIITGHWNWNKIYPSIYDFVVQMANQVWDESNKNKDIKIIVKPQKKKLNNKWLHALGC